MALPYYSKSDMSYYTNFSSASYPYYWPNGSSPTNITPSRFSLYGSSSDSDSDRDRNSDINHDGTSRSYEDVMFDLVTTVISSESMQKWILSIIGCVLVGLSGIFPLLLIPTTKMPNSVPSSNNALLNGNATAKSNIPATKIANCNGNSKKMVSNGHHHVNGACKPESVAADKVHKVNSSGNGVVTSSSSCGASEESQHDVNKAGISPKVLKRLLSFAVGSLLGDVFLHLLPEAWAHGQSYCASDHDTMMKLGLWVLVGIVSFLGCEMLVANANCDEEDEEETETSKICIENGSAIVSSNNNDTQVKVNGCNGHTKHMIETKKYSQPIQPLLIKTSKKSQKEIAGYLNLVANCFDNFTHGLAVAGSFIVSPKIGMITTAAILLHEIPHEIGDFAILLRSGFNPWSAAKAQLSTALVGLLGAIFTLSCDSIIIGDFTWWILPFTSGCFIQIAMSSILPDLMNEEDPVESCLHFIFLLFGIGIMGFVTFVSGV